MIHMSPYQSWTTVLLLVVFAAAIVWLIHELNRARAESSRLAASAADVRLATAAATTVRYASVTELRPDRARQLTLVPDLPREASPEVYDWQVSGL
ncbi:hypothetical protein [Cryobacterium zhongshanensis]|uniref:Uncharacterized protein n=1 Tax=Cryobacterium zhongshanensis TaxID=2928153 RepID=A0AA41QYB1_9MICO|nr:hypothetical protein [Cryobacterium zhongshanensis]MCI4659757.1 hypothetical protein [Cryobacterium zhongshanensis]